MKINILIRILLIGAAFFAIGAAVGYERGADQARTVLKERLEK